MQSQRKVNILHELDIAIKKKAEERSKDTKEISKHLLSSHEKKYPPSSSYIPSFRNKSTDKQPHYRNQSAAKEPHFSSTYHNTEFFKLTQQLSERRFSNRKMDKLVGLINYVLSSADKVMRHVNVSNFEAEFSLKLFLSDKQTLLSELENMKIEDLGLTGGSSHSKSTKTAISGNNTHNNVLIIQNHSLRAQNSEYKKELMLLQGQIKKVKEQKLELGNEIRLLKFEKQKQSLDSYTKPHSTNNKQVINLLKQMEEIQQTRKQDKLKENQLKYQITLKDKESQKYIKILKETINTHLINTLVENVNKSSKVDLIKFGNSKTQKNEKKRGELELILGSLESQFKDIVNDVKNIKKQRENLWRLVEEKEKMTLNQLQLYEVLRKIVEKSLDDNTGSTSNQRQKSKEKQMEKQKEKQIEKIRELQLQIKELIEEKDNQNGLNNSRVKLLQETRIQFNSFMEQTTARLRQLCLLTEIRQNQIPKLDIDELINIIQQYFDNRPQNTGQLEAKSLIQEQLRQGINELEKERIQLEQKYLNQVKGLRQQLERVEAEMDKVVQRQKGLIGRVKQQQKDVKQNQINKALVLQLNEQLSNKQTKLTQLEKQRDQNEDLRKQVVNLQESLDDKSKQILTLSASNEDKLTIINSVREELKQLEQSNQPRDATQPPQQEINYQQLAEKNQLRIQELEEQKLRVAGSHEQMINLLRIEFSKEKQWLADQVSVKQTSLNTEIEILKGELQHSHQKILLLAEENKANQSLSSVNLQLQSVIQQIRRELQQVKGEKEQAILSLTELKTVSEERQERLKELESSTNLGKQSESIREGQRLRLEQQITDLKNVIESTRSLQQEQIKTITLQLNTENKLLSDRIQSLQRQFGTLRQESNIDKQQLESNKGVIDRMRQQESANIKRLEQLESEKQKYRTESQHFQKQLEQIQHETNKLKAIKKQFEIIQQQFKAEELLYSQTLNQDRIQRTLSNNATPSKKQQGLDQQIGDPQVSSIKKKQSVQQQDQDGEVQNQPNVPVQTNPTTAEEVSQDKVEEEPIIKHENEDQMPLIKELLIPVKYETTSDYEPIKESESIDQGINIIEIQKGQENKESEQEQFVIKSTKHLSISDLRKNSVLDRSDIISNDNKSRIANREGENQQNKEKQDKQVGVQEDKEKGQGVGEDGFDDFKDEGDISQLDSSNINISLTDKQPSKHPEVVESEFNDVEQTESLNNSVIEPQVIPDNKEQTLQKQKGDLILSESILKENQLSESQFDNFEEPALSQSMVSNHQKETVDPQPVNNISVGDFGEIQPDQMSKSLIHQDQKDEVNLDHPIQQNTELLEDNKQQVKQQPLPPNAHPDLQNFQDFNDEAQEPLDSSILSQNLNQDKADGQ